MKSELKSLIQKLVEAPAPPGYERGVRETILTEIESQVDEWRVDNLGNLIARKGQANGVGKKIMLAAHMDEVGLIVTHVDERGFIRFLPLGNASLDYLLGSRVRFLNGVYGVIGREYSDDPFKPLGPEQLFIDVGCASRSDCPLQVGDVAVPDRPLMTIGNRVVSKALDNRAGVAVMIATLQLLSQDAAPIPNEIYFVFTAQSKVGPRGAAASAYGIGPDIGIAVDVTLSADTPKAVKMEVGLGKGPAIKVKDQGLIADPRVVRWMVETAQRHHLPYQVEILEQGSTDAQAIQITRAGVPAGCLSIPCRYWQTQSETVDLDDLTNCVKLLNELIRNPVKWE